jgi:hypothetical protein
MVSTAPTTEALLELTFGELHELADLLGMEYRTLLFCVVQIPPTADDLVKGFIHRVLQRKQQSDYSAGCHGDLTPHVSANAVA